MAHQPNSQNASMETVQWLAWLQSEIPKRQIWWKHWFAAQCAFAPGWCWCNSSFSLRQGFSREFKVLGNDQNSELGSIRMFFEITWQTCIIIYNEFMKTYPNPFWIYIYDGNFVQSQPSTGFGRCFIDESELGLANQMHINVSTSHEQRVGSKGEANITYRL